jgi:glycosyltransferase involved in cell wall biosynthesis
MACGTPVVSTRNIGSQYVLEDGKYGMLGSDDEMADCLCRLLEDRENAEALFEKGLNRARDFDIRRVAETYIDLYHEAIHG